MKVNGSKIVATLSCWLCVVFSYVCLIGGERAGRRAGGRAIKHTGAQTRAYVHKHIHDYESGLGVKI
jgi:hypothetical protein